jgi:quercetin dioxygenase-like cupin family protein
MLTNPEHLPRRIVATQGADGKSHLVQVEEIQEDARSAASGRASQLFRIWAVDGLPVGLPWDGGSMPVETEIAEQGLSEVLSQSTRVPDPGQLRIHMVRHPPNSEGPPPHLHWHDTVDVQWVFEGQMTLGLDDGSEVVLGPLDAAILYGANHSWRAGPEGALVAVINVGAERVGPTPPLEQQRSDAPGHPSAAVGPGH